jgi:ABC-2 type transport system ATP-binding protein
VILSTHIVEDVPTCARAWRDLVQKARGSVWRKTIERADLEAYRSQYEVISARLFAGDTRIHILSDRGLRDG